MELGLVYTPVMAVPPGETAFVLTGYCTDKCTQRVSAQPSEPLPLGSCWKEKPHSPQPAAVGPEQLVGMS